MSVSSATLAQMVRNSAGALGKAASGLGEHFAWRPLDKGRSAHDQVLEVAGLYLVTKQLIETGELPPLDRSAHLTAMAEFDTPEKALKQLTDAADLLGIAVEVAPTERLQKVVALPFGPGMEKTIAEVVLMAYWNTVYHEGQVNYIQTLNA
ncbi:MAG: hypothetical protein H7145_10500 [Akkermansiaceae bacterium]|nr:hypothetical protein [Armatimonadota bacterium]